MSDLKKKAVKGMFWSAIDSFGMYFVKFAFSIAIARLLSPEDYGLVGMLAIFMGFAYFMYEGGFTAALIHKKDAGQTDFSTAFYFNISLAIIFYVIFFFSADLIARFFEEPRLVVIARVVSLDIIIGALGLVQRTILIKNLNFKLQAQINAVSTLFAGLLGLILAYNGYGYWALICQILFGNLGRLGALWVLNKWRPRLEFSVRSFKEMYSYGYKILLQGLMDSLFLNFYSFIIGKTFSVKDLGYYTRARRFQNLFVVQLTSVFRKVTFPVFSSIKNEKEKFQNAYIRLYKLMIFVVFPLMTLLIVTTKSFVLFFLTEKWAPAIPYIQLIYLEGLIYPIYILNLNIFNALGKSDIFLKVEVINKLMALLSIAIFINWGINWLILGRLTSLFLAFILSTFVVKKEINIRVYEQISDLLQVVVASLFMYSICVLISWFNLNELTLMLIQGSTGLTLYFLIFRTIKPSIYKTFQSVALEYIPPKLKWVL